MPNYRSPVRSGLQYFVIRNYGYASPHSHFHHLQVTHPLSAKQALTASEAAAAFSASCIKQFSQTQCNEVATRIRLSWKASVVHVMHCAPSWPD
jgi:hypothetical protein